MWYQSAGAGKAEVIGTCKWPKDSLEGIYNGNIFDCVYCGCSWYSCAGLLNVFLMRSLTLCLVIKTGLCLF